MGVPEVVATLASVCALLSSMVAIVVIRDGRDAAMELGKVQAHLAAAQEQIAAIKSQAAGHSDQMRSLQQAVEDSVTGQYRRMQQHNDSQCLDNAEIAFSAIQSTYAVSQAFDAFSTRILPGLLSQSTGGEVEACRCVICADTPKGGPLCLPWVGGPTPVPCDCLGIQASTAVATASFPSSRACIGEPNQGYNDVASKQLFPASNNTPPCCRQEWNEFVAINQVPGTKYYSQSEVVLKICGEISFNWRPGNFENVREVDANGVLVQGGIRSGDPSSSMTQFNHTFSQPGVYHFQSQVSTTLAVKITVVQCDYCTVTVGYDGSQPRSFAVALSSRSPGNYSLRVADHASLGYTKIYANQTATITGTTAAIGQLTLLDAMFRVLPGGELTLNRIHVSERVIVERGGKLNNVNSMVNEGALALPQIDKPFPKCEPAVAGSILYDPDPNGNGDIMRCGESGVWSSLSKTTFDGVDFKLFVTALKNAEVYTPHGSSFWNSPSSSNHFRAHPGHFNLRLSSEVTTAVLTQTVQHLQQYFGEPSGFIRSESSRAQLQFLITAGQHISINGVNPVQRVIWQADPYVGLSHGNQNYQGGLQPSTIASTSDSRYRQLFALINGGHLSLTHIKFQGGHTYSGSDYCSSNCNRRTTRSVRPSIIRAQQQSQSAGFRITIEDCEFHGFSAYVNDGSRSQGHYPAIYMHGNSDSAGSSLTVRNSKFSSNAGPQAGAIYGTYVRVVISKTEFQSNSPCQCYGNCCDSRYPPWNNAQYRSSLAVRVSIKQGGNNYQPFGSCGDIQGETRSSQACNGHGSYPTYFCCLKNGD